MRTSGKTALAASRRTRVTTFLVICAALCLAGCSGQGGNSSSSGSSGTSKGPRVMGERLTTRQIIDQQQNNLVVGVVAIPESWKFTSNVAWNYANVSNAVTISSRAENPSNSEAVFGYPPALFFYLQPGGSFYQPGQNYGGLVFMPAQPPLNVFASFIRQARTGVSKLQFLGSKNLPDLPAALQLARSPNQRGMGVKVSYELNGQPTEEEFYAVFDSITIPYDGPQGRTYQINWGLEGLHSFRGPAGTLGKRRPVLAAIAKSFRPNPAWQQRHDAINKYLAAQFNAQLKAGYDQIAAAGRLSQQLTANSNEFLAGVDRQLQAERSAGSASSSGSSEGRSSADKFDDYIRGVDTVDDPYYGTSQQSSNEQYHWTDGYGNYANTNDPTADPNRTEVGEWTLMKNVP